MAERSLALVCLAAGKGSRLAVSDDVPPKVLVPCLGVPLLEHVRRATAPLRADVTLVLTGHQHERVESWLATAWPDATPVLQSPQLGTGHAVRIAMEAIPDFDGDVLVVYGDVPQLMTADLVLLRDKMVDQRALAALLTGTADEPGSLGRVVRRNDGRFMEIVEAKDAQSRPDILRLHEFNTGMYCFRAAALREALAKLTRDNAQGEEYLTDALGHIAATGARVAAVPALDAGSLVGVNTLEDLAAAHSVMRRRVATNHLRSGVIIVDPDTTIIETDVEIGRGATIHPFTHIARGCRIASGAQVGPFARLRGNTVLRERAEVGNFVEVKKSVFEAGAKAKHLTYVGDATVGTQANIGCGTITANYDGMNKHATHIGAGAHIGSGTVLVAPVSVGDGARTGANAVVLSGRDVPAGSTAVGVPARTLPSSTATNHGMKSDGMKSDGMHEERRQEGRRRGRRPVGFRMMQRGDDS